MAISTSFTGELLKVALIAGIFLALFAGIIPGLVLTSLPWYVWALVIMLVIVIIVRRK